MASFDANALAKITGAECHIAPMANNTTMPQNASTPTYFSSHMARREPVFLVLAPVLSTDHPTPASLRASSFAVPKDTSAVDMTLTVEAADQLKKDRRSSSVSSNGTFRRRILKLGPVHDGGEPGVSDYVELDEE